MDVIDSVSAGVKKFKFPQIAVLCSMFPFFMIYHSAFAVFPCQTLLSHTIQLWSVVVSHLVEQNKQ